MTRHADQIYRCPMSTFEEEDRLDIGKGGRIRAVQGSYFGTDTGYLPVGLYEVVDVERTKYEGTWVILRPLDQQNPRRRNPAPYGHEEILRFSRGTLHTPDGPIKMHQIGKGAFSLAMVEDGVAPGVRPRVFVFSADDVYDKELLAMAHEADPANPHLPKVERFGYTQDKAVFVMPLYRAPLRKTDSPEGWRDYTMLKKCRDKVYGMRKSGYEVNEDVYACAEAAGVRPSVLDALRVLIDTAANYGAEYVFEFSPRNLATDDAGNLVLLDVLYDRERLTQLRRAAATQRGG